MTCFVFLGSQPLLLFLIMITIMNKEPKSTRVASVELRKHGLEINLLDHKFLNNKSLKKIRGRHLIEIVCQGVWMILKAESVKNHFQNAPRPVPSEVQTAFGVQFGLGNVRKTAPDAKSPANLEPKLIQNPVGSCEKSKNICFRNQL